MSDVVTFWHFFNNYQLKQVYLLHQTINPKWIQFYKEGYNQ